MKYLCSLIAVENIERSRKFYESIMGMKVEEDYGENVVFEDSFSIHDRKHFRELINGKEILHKSNSFELYFEENKVNDLFNKLKDNHVEFIHEPREQPWRQLVMRFYDPDGHIIEVGESLEYLAVRLHKEGLDIDEICRITYFDSAKVAALIRENNT